MEKEFSRTQRVAGLLKKEIAYIIQREIKDPRLGMATVVDVSVTKDLFFADIYVSFLDFDSSDSKLKINILKKAESFIRSALGKVVKLRVVPNLRFHLDESLQHSTHISNLIDKIKTDTKK